MDGTTRRSRPGFSSMIALALAALQGICAIIVLGLVAVRFSRTSFSAAVFSVIVSVLTILTCLAFGYYALRPTTRRLFIIGSFGWQFILVVLWAAVAGILGRRRGGSTGLAAAMALSLILMLSFLAGTVVQGFSLWRGRRAEGKAMHGGV